MLWVGALVILPALAADAVFLGLNDGVAFGSRDVVGVFVPLCSMSVLPIDKLLARAKKSGSVTCVAPCPDCCAAIQLSAWLRISKLLYA